MAAAIGPGLAVLFRRSPAPAATTRAALFGWWRPSGSASCGTPTARALITVPCPPWLTTAAACGSTAACCVHHGCARRRARRARLDCRAGRHEPAHRQLIECGDDSAQQVGLVHESRGHADQDERLVAWGQLGGLGPIRVVELRADVAHVGRQLRGEVERPGSEHEHARGRVVLVEHVRHRGQPEFGAGGVERRDAAVPQAGGEPVDRGVAEPAGAPASGETTRCRTGASRGTATGSSPASLGSTAATRTSAATARPHRTTAAAARRPAR